MSTIGIEWVNKYNGYASDLHNNDDNAKGFYTTLDGIREFDWGDDNAWDQDFEEKNVGSPPAGTDEIYADNVDICFFSGHGSPSGPSFGRRDRDDGRARFTELKLGNRQLEWIIFDACQVLNEDGVFDRWVRTFHGLHYILGFHSNTSDSPRRGRVFAENLNRGWTVREAWIRACEETEGSSVEWAYLRADSPGTDTYNDHWWGKGYVSPDPNPDDSTLFYGRGSC